MHLGDGFCRVCLILTGLTMQGPKLLLVDEIDSGLHNSVMDTFWKSLIDITKITGGQVFCSTHNEEMLHTTLGAFANDQNALRIFRLDRSEEGPITAQKYDYQAFASADNAGLDVR